MNKFDKEMIGATFGKLTVIEKAGVNKSPNGKTNSRWLCKCECGKTITPMRHDLKRGSHKSCGKCLEDDSYIYIVQDKKFVKIGFAKDPESRLAQLQTGNPRRLKLIKKILCEDYKRIEKKMHKIFESKNVSGEWFKIKPRVAIKQIEKLLK